jgi:hypothetical protein
MITALNDAAAAVHTVTSLRAACHALATGSSRVSAVSVSGRLPPDCGALPILSAAERLAGEYGCAVLMRLGGGRFQIRFSRGADRDDPLQLEAG